jgi:hypothetical protein
VFAAVVLSYLCRVLVCTVKDSVCEESALCSRDGRIRDIGVELSRITGEGGVV